MIIRYDFYCILLYCVIGGLAGVYQKKADRDRIQVWRLFFLLLCEHASRPCCVNVLCECPLLCEPVV